MRILRRKGVEIGGMPIMYACRDFFYRLRAISLSSVALASSAALMQVSPALSAEGLSPLEIFIKSYIDEWGKPPVSDPNALPTRWPTTLLPPQPETIPPYPFTEWPLVVRARSGRPYPTHKAAL